jgi:hypothetical protein
MGKNGPCTNEKCPFPIKLNHTRENCLSEGGPLAGHKVTYLKNLPSTELDHQGIGLPEQIACYSRFIDTNRYQYDSTALREYKEPELHNPKTFSRSVAEKEKFYDACARLDKVPRQPFVHVIRACIRSGDAAVASLQRAHVIARRGVLTR